jgi:1-acyl-sn-glycerol-3-phosphate acyltransferase
VLQWVRSSAFTLYLFVSVPFFGIAALLAAPFSKRAVYAVAVAWSGSVMRLLKVTCGLGCRVDGLEHLTAETRIELKKHTSACETIAQLQIFPRQTSELKRELLWIPIFGWVLRLLEPIAIDRRGGRVAVQQVLDQGTERLEKGRCVIVFPEGTRMPAGQTRKYGISGALLATTTKLAVLPVAHNAGEFWPRRGLLTKRGVVRVVIGPPIPAAGRDPRAVNDEAQRWIEETVANLTGRPMATVIGAGDPRR